MTRDDVVSSGTLPAIARASIVYGLHTGTPKDVDLETVPMPLREPGAAFVTLTRDARLRGCVGCLTPRLPVAIQVSNSAFQAAFADPRMPPVTADELPSLRVRVSVLSPLRPLTGSSDQALAAQLRPGIDGLLAESAAFRATFLPRVWADLPDPDRFVAGLRRKAGLGSGDWPPGTRFYCYSAREWSESPSS